MGVHITTGNDVLHMQFFLSGMHHFEHPAEKRLYRIEVDVLHFAPAIVLDAWQMDAGVINWTGTRTQRMQRWSTVEIFALTRETICREFPTGSTAMYLFAARFKAIMNNVNAEIKVMTPRAFAEDGSIIPTEVLHGNMVIVNQKPVLSLSYEMMTRVYALTRNPPVYSEGGV